MPDGKIERNWLWGIAWESAMQCGGSGHYVYNMAAVIIYSM